MRAIKALIPRCTIAGIALLLLVGGTLRNDAALFYSWSGNQEIPDNEPGGVAYSFNLSDPSTTSILDLSVTLVLSGGYNGDLFAYLSHGSGYSVLLNRVGLTAANPDGYADPGFNITLSLDATADIHLYQTLSPSYNGDGQLTGTWAADGRNLDSILATGAEFDSAARDATLNTFDGLDPNGSWTLFIADVSFGGVSTLEGWSVDASTVPEPTWAGLAAVVAMLLAAAISHLRLASQSQKHRARTKTFR